MAQLTPLPKDDVAYPYVKKIRKLFSDPSRWTTGAFARKKSGEACLPSDSAAHSFCLLGALEKQNLRWEHIAPSIGRALGVRYLANWNDNQTYESLTQALDGILNEDNVPPVREDSGDHVERGSSGA